MGSKRKKLPGRYCRCCDQRRPNEHFSGRGHRKHVCKDCMKLGQEELAYRQHLRHIDRLLNGDGIICRKNRAVFERYLSHPDPRVRGFVTALRDHSEQRRQERHELFEEVQLEEDRYDQYLARLEREADAHDEERRHADQDLEEIPF